MRGIRAGLSDREHDSAEGAALNQVTQSMCGYPSERGLVELAVAEAIVIVV